MPIPTPNKNEGKDAFVSRCVSKVSKIDTDRNHDQIVAMCFSKWEKHKGE